MNKHTLHSIGWLVVGMLLMGVIVWITMPSLMLVRHKSSHGYDETVAILSETLKQKQNWKVLKVNDYQEATKDFGPIERIGSINICNPGYASKILAAESDRGVTAFMPLSIGIYEDKSGQVYVSQLNVGLMGMMFGGTIAEVMGSAGSDVSEVIESIK